MSTLRSAIEELQADDLGAAGDDAIETDLAEVLRAARALRSMPAIRGLSRTVISGGLPSPPW